MHTDADHELLRRYAEQGDEEAFTELVQRHLNLVWAAALRVSGNTESKLTLGIVGGAAVVAALS